MPGREKLMELKWIAPHLTTCRSTRWFLRQCIQLFAGALHPWISIPQPPQTRIKQHRFKGCSCNFIKATAHHFSIDTKHVLHFRPWRSDAKQITLASSTQWTPPPDLVHPNCANGLPLRVHEAIIMSYMKVSVTSQNSAGSPSISVCTLILDVMMPQAMQQNLKCPPFQTSSTLETYKNTSQDIPRRPNSRPPTPVNSDTQAIVVDCACTTNCSLNVCEW